MTETSPSPQVSPSAANNTTMMRMRKSKSVTLLSQEALPSYSSERFYLLSEMEQTARETLFLCDLCPSSFNNDGDNDDDDEETRSTQESQSVLSEDGHNDNTRHENVSTIEATNTALPSHTTAITPILPTNPRFVILYLLWQPNHTQNIDDFVETVVLWNVQRVLHVYGLSIEQFTTASETGLHIYCIIDRVDVVAVANDYDHTSLEDGIHMTSDHTYLDIASSPSSTGFTHCQQRARQLAHQVATHSCLRRLLQGINVAISNHIRATPGLEACIHALQVGSEDRNRFGSDERSKKSSMSVMTTHHDALIGSIWQHHQQGDEQQLHDLHGANNVLQTRMVAEWNANGNLHSFAQRAHAEWRRDHGLLQQPCFIGPARKPVPRIMKRLPVTPPMKRNGNTTDHQAVTILSSWRNYNPNVVRRKVKQLLTDGMVLLLLGVYLWYHFRHEIMSLYDHMDMDSLVQHLRAL